MSPDVLLALQILSTTIYAIALLTTAFRIIHRIRIARFWWDDLWALVSACLAVILLVFLWLQPHVNIYGTMEQQIIAAWLVPQVFVIVVWTTRISICYSITRILPPGKSKTASLIMIAAFFLSCSGVFAGKIWLCGHDSSWHHVFPVFCPQNDALSVVQSSTDIISSLCLVAFPLHVLWNVELPAIEKRLILSLFTASSAITALAISHSVFAFENDIEGAQLFGHTGHLEASVSLITCNILVVGTRFYTLFRRSVDEVSAAPPAVSISQLEGQPLRPVTFTQFTHQHDFTFSYPDSDVSHPKPDVEIKVGQ